MEDTIRDYIRTYKKRMQGSNQGLSVFEIDAIVAFLKTVPEA